MCGQLRVHEHAAGIDRQPARDPAHEMTRKFETGFMAKRSRRCAVLLAERATEIRGIVEAPAETDIGDRYFFIERINEIRAATLKPACPQIRREILPHCFE